MPLVVEERVSGLAFGVVTSAQNLACALVPLAIAAIYSESNDKYIPNVELLFIAFASIGFLVGLYMNYYDYHHDSVLNRSADAAEAAVARDARNSTVFSPLLNPIGNEDLESSSISHDGRQRSSEYDQQGLHHRHNRQSRASQDGRGHQPTFTVYEEAHRGGVHAVVVPSSHEGSMKLSSDN